MVDQIYSGMIGSFEKLSSWCCNNVAMITSLLVAGEHLLRYWAVPLTL